MSGNHDQAEQDWERAQLQDALNQIEAFERASGGATGTGVNGAPPPRETDEEREQRELQEAIAASLGTGSSGGASSSSASQTPGSSASQSTGTAQGTAGNGSTPSGETDEQREERELREAIAASLAISSGGASSSSQAGSSTAGPSQAQASAASSAPVECETCMEPIDGHERRRMRCNTPNCNYAFCNLCHRQWVNQDGQSRADVCPGCQRNSLSDPGSTGGARPVPPPSSRSPPSTGCSARPPPSTASSSSGRPSVPSTYRPPPSFADFHRPPLPSTAFGSSRSPPSSSPRPPPLGNAGRYRVGDLSEENYLGEREMGRSMDALIQHMRRMSDLRHALTQANIVNGFVPDALWRQAREEMRNADRALADHADLVRLLEAQPSTPLEWVRRLREDSAMVVEMLGRLGNIVHETEFRRRR